MLGAAQPLKIEARLETRGNSDLRTDTAQTLGYGESRVSIQNYMDGTAIAHGGTEQQVEYRNSQQDSPMTKHQVT